MRDSMRRSISALFAGFLTILAALTIWAPVSLARDFTDSAGRRVTLPAKVERVFVAGPPASVILYTLAPETLLGWTRPLSDAEKAYIAPAYRDLPVTGRLAGQGSTANAEALLKLKPDMILDVGTIDPSYVSLAERMQTQTGIPYVLLDGSFAKTADSYRQLGELLGLQDRAAPFAAYAEETLNALRARTNAVPQGERPRVYYGRGANGLETGLAGSINLEVLESVGAVNVAAEAGRGGLTQVSLEQVLKWNPDVILALDGRFKQSALTDPSWSGIKAVQAKTIYVAPGLPFGWFDAPPSVNRLIGVRWLSRLLYPGVVSDDLAATTRDFYQRFYHVTLGDAQLATLMRDAVGP
jgi:iron complex transport system substrate-binding protein